MFQEFGNENYFSLLLRLRERLFMVAQSVMFFSSAVLMSTSEAGTIR